MSFGLESVHTIVRSGTELVFTAQETLTPAFNPADHWVVTLIFGREERAEKAEQSLRALIPMQFYQGGDVTGIVAHAGHSLQSIGVSQTIIDRLAYQRGVTLRLASLSNSAHRDYYVTPLQESRR
jgi:hypothetical protein